MFLDSMETLDDGKSFTADALDLVIIGELLREPDSTFKGIAAVARVDQRTIARRVIQMKDIGVIRHSFEVEWGKIGVNASAIVGCTTSVGEKALGKLRDYIRGDPRIVEGYETVGAHEYVIKVLGNDLPDLRNSVLRNLEPLAADLTASVITSQVKKKDYFKFARYLRETRYPETRSFSWDEGVESR